VKRIKSATTAQPKRESEERDECPDEIPRTASRKTFVAISYIAISKEQKADGAVCGRVDLPLPACRSGGENTVGEGAIDDDVQVVEAVLEDRDPNRDGK
jgi:hypothetical protein